jgi:hypothetical protein
MTAADRANRPMARLFRFRNSGRRVGTNISAQATLPSTIRSVCGPLPSPTESTWFTLMAARNLVS